MKRIIVVLALAAGLFGCQNEKRDKSVASTEEIRLAEMADTVATEKIVKTADIRFRVKDVQQTKENLSKRIKAEGGTIAEFSTESIIQETQKVKLSADSLKEITAYRTEGYLVAKVPAERLDDFTNTIAKMALFVDRQSMKLDDQSLMYLANKLKADNREDAVRRINKLATKKSPNVETSLLIKDDYVDKKIQNLLIDSRVKYSTITLNFYQDNTIKTMTVANDNVYDYKPGFANRLWLSITNGWTIFKEIILGIANLWMLIIVALALFFIIKYFVKKDKKARDLAARNWANQSQS
ncbi:DUF4349 domain-containing protein [Pedobacter frigidisoli]|uniref:DUF4349 domain-containing protein n=1 Tax=Pedobacter frigidisoli TaxID=2530455 RepID=UPI00292F9EF7|nr:DUF4349 domain-containing protein [Pedobacter frigidisoli]